MALTLEDALARLPQWRGRPDLHTSVLSGGITNQNYRVETGGEVFVVRISGDNTELLGIDRQNERAATIAAAALGIGPEVIFFIEPEGCLVTRFVAGKPIMPDEIRQPETIRQIAACLRRVHQMPAIPGSFSPFQVVTTYRRLADERRVTGYPADSGQFFDRMRAIETAFEREPIPVCPCHNDLLNENFLRDNTTGQIRILDWEYAGMGDPYFDLANLAAQHAFRDEHDRLLLEAYFGEATPRGLARLKLMKCMSDFREAVWGMLQSGISNLDFDFRGYARKYFQRLTAGFGNSRVDEWLARLEV
jgi:thiamine kinase-like enzyme